MSQTRTEVEPAYNGKGCPNDERDECGERASREERPLNEDPAINLGPEHECPSTRVYRGNAEMNNHEHFALAKDAMVALLETSE